MTSHTYPEDNPVFSRDYACDVRRPKLTKKVRNALSTLGQMRRDIIIYSTKPEPPSRPRSDTKSAASLRNARQIRIETQTLRNSAHVCATLFHRTPPLCHGGKRSP